MHNENGQTTHTIEEVAAKLGISKSLIRFWEEEFDLHRHENGLLSCLEMEEIKAINKMIQEREMALEEAKIAFSHDRKLLEVKYRTLHRLIEIRQSLINLKDKITENGTSSD